jgi:hypothetical protein
MPIARSLMARNADYPQFYTTSFATTENPLSEGIWVNGGAVGLDWADMRCDGVHAYGTQTPLTPPPYNDSHAHLRGFRADHSVQGTIYRTGSTLGLECNLFLRQLITPHNSRGYEINLYLGGPSLGLVRWNGALNDFTPLVENITTNCSFNDGDVWYAQAVGAVITVKCNGTTVLTYDTASDGTRWATGQPGMGHYATDKFGAPGANSNVGWRNFTAAGL